MADVIASLQRSNALPLYSHIERIESPTAWTLDIHLRQPDRWLPWLLGQVPAMVLPQEWQTMNHFSSMPVGTGPYAWCVTIRTSSRSMPLKTILATGR